MTDDPPTEVERRLYWLAFHAKDEDTQLRAALTLLAIIGETPLAKTPP